MASLPQFFQGSRAARIATALVVGLLFGSRAAAHSISVVVETAFVERKVVHLEVVIFAEDLAFYHDLEPNDANEIPAEALRTASREHGPLLLNRLPVYDGSGEPLSGGRVVSVKGNEFPEAIPIGELMGYDVRYRLEYPLEAPPEFLSFSQRLVDESAGFPALVDLRVKQAGREEEVTATLKPGHVRTVRLDWNQETQDVGNAQREAWMRAGREDALAANALNSVRSFLYIDRRQVRHEILMPFPLLESFITIDRADPATITAAEQEAARAKIGQFFRGKNPITIDGEQRQPGSARVEFFTLDDLNRTQSTPPRAMSTINSRVGVMLSYPTRRPAVSLELRWDAFNRQAWRVDAFCFVGDDVLRPELSMATRKTTFQWKRPEMPEPITPRIAAAPQAAVVTIPWLALALGGAGCGFGWWFWGRAALVGASVAAGLTLASAIWPGPSISFTSPWDRTEPIAPRKAETIVEALHHNLYLACRASTDAEALKAISAAADGELRRRMYLQLVEATHAPGELGLKPAVGEVAITSGEVRNPATADGGFDYAFSWEATGRAEHFGHVHSRRYAYEATMHAAPRDGRWLMTELNLKRVRLLKDRTMGVF